MTKILRDRNMVEVIGRRFILGFIIAIMFGLLIVTLVPSVSVSPVEVEKGNRISSLVGYESFTEPLTLSTPIVILNSTPFRLADDWEIGGEVIDFGRNDAFSITENGRETEIFLENSEVFLRHVSHFDIGREGQFSFSVRLRGIVGSVNAGIAMSIWKPYSSLPDEIIKSECLIIEPGDTFSVDLNVTLADIRLMTDKEIRSVIFTITLGGTGPSVLAVQDVVISLSVSDRLSSLSIDIQSLEGNSVFAAPASPNLVRLYVSSYENSSYGGIIYISRVNDTVLLGPGNYSLRVDPYYDYLEGIGPINCTISINEGIESILYYQLPFVRVFLDIQPDVPYIELSLLYENDWYYLYFSFQQLFPSFIYIPFEEGVLELEIYIPAHSDSPHSEILGYRISVDMDFPRDISLKTRFPYFVVAKITVAPGELILGLLIISLISSAVFRERKTRNWGTRTILSFCRDHWAGVIILIGLFMPWFVSSHSRFYSRPPATTYRWILGPKMFVVDGSSQYHWIVVDDNIIWLFVLFIVLLVMYQDQRRYGWAWGRRYGLILGLVVIIGGCMYLLLPSRWTVGFGLYLLFTAFFVRIGEIVIYPRVSHLFRVRWSRIR